MSDFDLANAVHEAPDVRDEMRQGSPALFVQHTIKTVVGSRPMVVTCSCGHPSESATPAHAVIAHEAHVREAMSLQVASQIRAAERYSLDKDMHHAVVHRILIGFIEEGGYDKGGAIRRWGGELSSR